MANTRTSLDSANALGLRSRASQVLEILDLPSLHEALQTARDTGRSPVVLGDGTNVVLGPQLGGPVLLMRSRGLSMHREGDACLLTAAAGENWHALVRFSLAQGLCGLENLALIPGRLGAAPIQNIGAYGVELSQVFERLEAVHRETGECRVFDRAACRFGYRTSIFKCGAANPWIIWRVTLRLNRTPRLCLHYRDVSDELERLGVSSPSALDVAEAVVRIRRRKLPDVRAMPNVGSFFKNPLVPRDEMQRLRARLPDLVVWPVQDGVSCKLSAAQLIDRAGLKGIGMQGARVWFRQPLVLVNESAAERDVFLVLAERVRMLVAERWGVTLEYEPDFYPALA